jgi:large subunit ribosomal protein L29
MKINEVRQLADKDLREKLDQTVAALVQMKLNHSISPLANPSEIKKTRRDIARMKQVLRQRELNK